MAAFVEARESARRAQKTLYYIQAVDEPQNLRVSSATDEEQLYCSLLQVSSLTKTKSLPAFALLQIDMEVRLTTTLDQPYAVQDATGKVVEIHFAGDDDPAHQHRRRGAVPESVLPEILVDLLPEAVLIKLHGCEHVFLPVQPCTACPVYTATCSACMAKRRALQGVFAVEPLPRTWKYDGPELEGRFINVKRRQLPLAPAKVLPLYSMQGMTATPGLVARWVVPLSLIHI